MNADYISRDLTDGRGLLARRGLAVLVVLALLAAAFVAVQGGMLRDTVTLTAEVDDVGGALVAGNDVKVRGAIIGRVDTIEARDDVVRLTLQVRPEEAERLPSGVTARILPATVFGTAFVDLVPPERPDGTLLASDAIIGQDESGETRELQDALDASHEILTAIEPARLSATLGAFANALDGRGESLGASIDLLDSYLTRLEPEIPLLREDLQLLATNMRTIEAIAPDLLDTLENSFTVTQTIVEQQDDIATLLTSGTSLVDEGHQILADHQQTFIDAVAGSAPIVDAMYDKRAGFSATFRAFVELAVKGAGAIHDPDGGGSQGAFLNTDVFIVPNETPPYGPEDCPVFGDAPNLAYGPNCGGTAGTGTTGGGTSDADLVAEVQRLLSALSEASAADPGGVGDLLTRGLVEVAS